jgi:tetratricopeptide (TPR) repeat protein
LQHSTPAAPAVRETLERLLASQTFGRSERARKLIRYLVEREQAGQADSLKGYSIAMDVFGKDGDFDPSTDAVVRVQAGRLRELLQTYFANEGVAEPLRIAIPRGGYVPAYELNAIRLPDEAAPGPKPRDDTAAGQVDHGNSPAPGTRETASAAAASTSPAQSVVRHLRFFWAAMAVVIVMLGVLIFRQGGSALLAGGELAATLESSGSIAPSPIAEALPLVYVDLQAGGLDADRVAASLRAGLSGFESIDFIGRDIASMGDRANDGASFIFEIMRGPNAGDITIELQSVSSGRVLLSRRLMPADSAPGTVEDRVADMLSSALPASGTIYNYIEKTGAPSGLVACLLLSDTYYHDQNARTHEAAYRCLEAMANAGAKSPLVYSGLASLNLEAANEHYAYPPNATIEHAAEFARRAVQMGPTSPYAHRAYGYVLSRLGNSEAGIRWMRKAYELNKYDLGMAAAYGYGLIFAGRYAEGTPILDHAAESFSAHSTWWDYGLFAGELMLGDMSKAAAASMALRTTATKSHYLAARLISAKAAGQDHLVTILLDELNAKFPTFAADPRATFVERKYPADLTDRLVNALRAAGLGKSS